MPEPTNRDIMERLVALEERLEAPIRFYVQATGVLAVVKWMGIAGIIGGAVLLLNALGVAAK